MYVIHSLLEKSLNLITLLKLGGILILRVFILQSSIFRTSTGKENKENDVQVYHKYDLFQDDWFPEAFKCLCNNQASGNIATSITKVLILSIFAELSWEQPRNGI